MITNHDTMSVFWLQVFPTGQDDTSGPASFFSVHVEPGGDQWTGLEEHVLKALQDRQPC